MFAMTECKPVPTPIYKDKPGPRMGEDPSCDRDLYLKLIGSLSWIAIGTDPDISFAFSYLGRFNTDPSLIYWTCAKRVLGYHKGTKHLKLSLGGELEVSRQWKEGFRLSGYVDSDFAGEATSLKSTTSYVLLHGSGIVQWHSKFQSITASSTANAEFIASVSAIQELSGFVNWFKKSRAHHYKSVCYPMTIKRPCLRSKILPTSRIASIPAFKFITLGSL